MGNYDPLLDRQNDGLIHTDLIMGNYDLAGDPLSDRDQKTELEDRAYDREQATLYHYEDRDEATDRELNSCECAAAPTGADRIVGGSTVDPKYKYPYTAYFQVATATLFCVLDSPMIIKVSMPSSLIESVSL